MVRWLRWHCPPDTGFEIRALTVWGRARYLSVTEASHNTDFHTWMGKKHFCFFQTAETGNRTPNSSVKGRGANHYPRAPALWEQEPSEPRSWWQPCLILLIKKSNYEFRRNIKMKWNQWSFRPPLCICRLNWAMRTSWGWWDECDDTALQSHEAEHAASQSRSFPTILNHCEWHFVSLKLEGQSGVRARKIHVLKLIGYVLPIPYTQVKKSRLWDCISLSIKSTADKASVLLYETWFDQQADLFNPYSAEIFCINNGDQSCVSILNNHTCLSQLFLFRLNTYAMVLRTVFINMQPL